MSVASSARWSEQHLVNWSATFLLRDWVGSVFFSIICGVWGRGGSALRDLPDGASCQVPP